MKNKKGKMRVNGIKRAVLKTIKLEIFNINFRINSNKNGNDIYNKTQLNIAVIFKQFFALAYRVCEQRQ
ncbi:hypothetical protein FACS1894113_1560 [Alphaproteobacteria bacterium]|nr:hypothetical protein FACS1894113_1560 [Alphaproteobacteria bacterium]